MKTVEQKRMEILKRIEACEEDIELLSLVIPILKEYEGKVLNRRLATTITKKTNLTCSWNIDVGLLRNLFIWKTDYNDRRRVFLGYTTDDARFSMDMFTKHNQPISYRVGLRDKYVEALDKLE